MDCCPIPRFCSWTSRHWGWMCKAGYAFGTTCKAMRERGITVVMTTNYLDEADQLCDRIAIIDGED